MSETNNRTHETILRRREVCKRTGLSRSTVYARIHSGDFPASISLGGSAVGWLESEVSAWIAGHASERRALAPTSRTIADATSASDADAVASTVRATGRSLTNDKS